MVNHMKNSLIETTGNFYRTDYHADDGTPWGPTRVISSNVAVTSDSFSFSGGGSNDPLKKSSFSNLAFTKVKVKHPTGTIRSRYFGTIIEVSGALLAQFSQPNDVTLTSYANLAYNEAIADLYDRIANAEFDVAMTVAELPETASLVKSLSSSILSIEKTSRRQLRKYNKVLSTGVLLKDASAAFLLAHLGIEPLIKDTYAMMNDVAKGYENKVYRFRSRKTRSSHDAIVKYYSGNGYLDLPRVSYGKASFRCEVLAEFVVSDPLQYRKNQLSLLDPEGIAWELVPASFVVDYFINIGQYLQSLEQSHRKDITFLRGYVCETSRTFEKMVIKLDQPMPGSIGTYYADAKAYRETKTLNRVVINGLPKPRAPVLKPISLGATRCLTIASLLTQLIL